MKALAKKIFVIFVLFKENGFLWTIYCGIYFSLRLLLNRDVRFFYKKMSRLEAKYRLPGFNISYIAGEIWDNVPIEREIKNWAPSREWERSLIDDVLLKYIPQGKRILEIGPGTGRWTETLQKISVDLLIVDVSKRCIEICRRKLGKFRNVKFFVNDGLNLDFLEDNSIDGVWSFDVFVHINPEETEKYIASISKKLKKGGQGIIHHPKDGGEYGGCRSSMTADLFASFLRKYALNMVAQFDSWGKDAKFNVRLFHDAITVSQK